MACPLPRLRYDLDLAPSPDPETPGLVIRDPFQYSGRTLLIPPPLVECLRCFDGAQTDLDLRAALVKITGDLRVEGLARHLAESLGSAGFLEDETYARLKEERCRAFAAAPAREAALAGSAYPAEPAALSALLAGCTDGAGARPGRPGLMGIAAPHVSLEGGRPCYEAAYGCVPREGRDRVFVVLGTSHYGRLGAFGLTRKPYQTPLGETRTVPELVEELERKGGEAVIREDYCHAVEHSIEFQVLFLQHICGPQVCVLPLLCGSYGRSLMDGCRPEDDPAVAQFLAALREMALREGGRLFWVLGVDMAHIGRRYGHSFAAEARRGALKEVEEADLARIARLEAADADGFWEEVRREGDPLHWCGAAPLYTFLRAAPGARGELLRYEQWNIDEASVVSFAALAFARSA